MRAIARSAIVITVVRELIGGLALHGQQEAAGTKTLIARRNAKKAPYLSSLRAAALMAGFLSGCNNGPSKAPAPSAPSQALLNGQLLEAARSNNVEGVKTMLGRGASADSFELNSHDGDTALIIACRQNNVEMARTLLNAGANPNLRQHGNWSDIPPLVACAATGHHEIALLLLDHGARVNARVGVDGAGATALVYACDNGQTGAVALLLANGATVHQLELGLAILRGHVEIVERLLKAGGDPRWTLGTGRTVLEEAQRSPEKRRKAMVAAVRAALGPARPTK